MHRQVLRDLALTPPLSPYPQHEGYFIPEDVACQVPLSSDTSTLLDDDLTKAEADLLQEDDYHADIPSLVDLEPLIKVEGPLTPLNSLPPSSELAVDMADLARCVDIDHVLDKQRSGIPDAKGVKDPNGMFSDDIMTSWPKDPQAERELRWSPFPSKMGHISMNEIIIDDGIAEVLLNFSGPLEVPTSGDYVWKHPGLAILRELDDDDEEEQELPYVSGEEKNIESLVRKRRLELNNSLDSASPVEVVHAPQAIGTKSYQTSLDEQGQNSHLLLGCNDNSATSTLLSNYLDFHTAKRQKNMKSSFFPTFPKQVDDVKTKVALSTSTKSQLYAHEDNKGADTWTRRVLPPREISPEY